MRLHGVLLLQEDDDLAFRREDDVAMIREEEAGRLEVIDGRGCLLHRPGTLSDLVDGPWVTAGGVLVHPRHARVEDGELVVQGVVFRRRALFSGVGAGGRAPDGPACVRLRWGRARARLRGDAGGEEPLTTRAQEILRDALQLTREERAELAYQLHASLEEEQAAMPREEWERLWLEEAERRWRELEDGSSQPVDGEELDAELEGIVEQAERRP